MRHASFLMGSYYFSQVRYAGRYYRAQKRTLSGCNR